MPIQGLPHAQPRRLAWLVAALSSTLLACACGGSSPATSPTAPHSTASPSSSVPTATPSVPVYVGTGVSGVELASRVTAAAQSAGSARITINEEGTKGTGTLDVRSGLRLAVSINDSGQRLKAVIIPGQTYVNDGEVVQGKHWIHIVGTAHSRDLRDLQGQLLGGAATVDPVTQARAWRSTRTFLILAKPKVGSVNTVEYYGTVNKAAYRAAYPALARAQMDLTKDEKVWVWLGPGDRPVKIQTVTAYKDGSEVDTTTFAGWGASPAVSPPPAADVVRGS